MKTKSLFLAALMLLIGGTVMAQDYTFRVLTAKGNNKASDNVVRVGSKLKSTDVVVMEEGGYLGLLHTNGQTLELRTKGTYKVGELANNIKASNGSSLTSRYANYVVSELTSASEEATGANRYKHMSKTGSVTRGELTELTLLQQKSVNVVGDELEIEWFIFEDLAKIKAEDVQKYQVTLKDLRNNVLFTDLTEDNIYVIDFSRPELKGQTRILYEVSIADEDKSKIKSASQMINIDTEKGKQIREQLSQIGDDTALGYLIKAQYLEEEGYFAEAAMAYKKSIELAPDVETYKILYDSFADRTTMSQKAIIEKQTKNAGE